jgi:hypothetical protein
MNRQISGNDLLHIQQENRQLRRRLQATEDDNTLLWLLLAYHAPTIERALVGREGAALRAAAARELPHLELVTSGGESNG